MFNLGLPEMIVLGVVALLVFGPRRLPELAKGLGKGLRDFKKAVSGDYDENNQPSPAPLEVVEPPMIASIESARKSGKKKATGKKTAATKTKTRRRA